MELLEVLDLEEETELFNCNDLIQLLKEIILEQPEEYQEEV